MTRTVGRIHAVEVRSVVSGAGTGGSHRQLRRDRQLGIRRLVEANLVVDIAQLNVDRQQSGVAERAPYGVVSDAGTPGLGEVRGLARRGGLQSDLVDKL